MSEPFFIFWDNKVHLSSPTSEILSVDSVFAAAMDRIINNKSVSELFE